MLNVKFAYSSNGKGIVEHDFITGMERNRPRIKPRIREWMMVYSFIREKFVDGLWARLASLRELQSPEGDAPQSAAGEELSHGDASQSALMPSILDKAFKGEL